MPLDRTSTLNSNGARRRSSLIHGARISARLIDLFSFYDRFSCILFQSVRSGVSARPTPMTTSVLFAGGYNRRDELFLVQLGNMRSTTITPVDGDGKPIKSFIARGRRDRLFLQNKDAFFVISVSDVDHE
jgi:hypothetical protein